MTPARNTTRRRWPRLLLAMVGLTAILPSCETSEIAAIRQNTLGVAFMNLQRTEEALAAFVKARELDAALVEARLNQAIALFNLQRLEEASEILLDLTGTQPGEVRVWYNLGLVYRNSGRIDDALMAFSRAVSLVPDDADSQYLLGLMQYQMGDDSGAVESYERALGINPFYASAEFGLASAYRRMGRADDAGEHFASYERIQAEGLGVPMSPTYGEQGRYSLAVDVAATQPAADETVAVRFTSLTGESGIGASSVRSASGHIASFLGGGACFLDWNGDGWIDLLIQNGSSGPELYQNREGRFSRAENALPALPADGTGCAAGDFDNDADTDLVLGFPGSVRLLANDGVGQFAEISETAGIVTEGLPLGVSFVDFDHDGDLDIYSNRFPDIAWNGSDLSGLSADLPAARNILWRNNDDGTFSEWTAQTALGDPAPGTGSVASDLDNDRAVDFVLTGWGVPPRILMNPREGQFIPMEWSGAVPESAVGVIVADFDKDSWMDLAFTHWGPPGLSVWKNSGGNRFDPMPLPDLEWIHGWGLAALDFDNDGWMDLVAAGGTDDAGEVRALRNTGAGGFSEVSAEVGLDVLAIGDPRALITADYDNDGDTDLVLTQNEGPVLLLRNDGGDRNPWVRLTLEGLNDNLSGIGTKVEVFAGAHRQKLEIQSGSGYLGQSALPFVAALGTSPSFETVRMLWPTGVVQDETDLGARQSHTILEIDRRPSSCPVLFVWNGSGYEFLTDLIGAGVLGHWVAPGQRNVSDPTEYARVPGSRVALRDGRISFRLAEPMEELVYLDQVRLLAVDHPDDLEVYPHEYFAAAPPFPEFRVIASRDARAPAGAWDDAGEPVTSDLGLRDGVYVGPVENLAFGGFARTHSLELDLGQTHPDRPLRLLMHGFVDYFSASSMFAAHQAGITPVLPYLEALDARTGKWTRVMDNLGFPAGLMRTMTRDITGSLPEGTRRIRITTNLRIYWDQILVDQTPDEGEVRITDVPLDQASLRWLGYPRAESGMIPSDIRYVYDDISPTGPYRRHSGDYTGFGDVGELVGTMDDRFAIFGSGEEVALEFDPGSLPRLEDGWSRDYFFYADGFSKDMDFYAADSSTVEPLPFHTMEPYPYASGERYPAEDAHLGYRLLWNTRHVSGRGKIAYDYAYPN